MQLPARLTQLSTLDAIKALAHGYEHVMGTQVDAKTLAILTSQTALETGKWRKMHCWNFGNLRPGGSSHYTEYECGENLPWDAAERYARENPSTVRIDRRYHRDGEPYAAVRFVPPHPLTRFRAYTSVEAGAAEFVRFLAKDTTPNDGRPNRYAAAWQAADDADDLEQFAAELKAAGYFTAELDRYVGGLRALYRELLPACMEYVMSAEPSIDENRVLELVALTLRMQGREYFAEAYRERTA